MAFGMSGLGGHRNTSVTSGAGKTASVSDAGQGREIREISDLKPGQTMRGEVIAKSGSEVQIRLDANTVMNARLEKDIALTLGQPMTFEVKSNTGTQLALRPLFENTGQDANSVRALQQAALPVNRKTLSMVSALMEQGMGIDKKTLQGVYRDMMTNPDSTARDVVALHKLQLPVTPESLHQISGYRNYEHQLLKGIETVAESIQDTILGLVDAGGGTVQEGAALLKNILQALAGSGESLTAQPEQADAASASGNGSVNPDSAAAGAGAALETEAGKQTAAEHLIPAQEDGAEIGQQKAEAPGQETSRSSVLSENIRQDTVLQGHPVETENAGKQLAGRDGMPLLTEAQSSSLAAQLESLGLSAEIAGQVRAGAIGAGELLEQIAQALGKGTVTKEALSSLMNGKGMQLLLKGQIENNWLLTPRQTASREEVDRLYSRLREQTGRLSRILSDAGKSGTELAKGVQNLKENVDFIQQLNQNFTYLQLPLKRFGKNAHGDLYVYTNKKNLAKKDGNVSALLHLDMEYLGSMDIYVSMQTERVSTKFYLQREEMLDFLEENMHLLNERLLKRGYTMTSEVLYKEKPANVAAEMMKQEGETSMLSMFSFDVRA